MKLFSEVEILWLKLSAMSIPTTLAPRSRKSWIKQEANLPAAPVSKIVLDERENCELSMEN